MADWPMKRPGGHVAHAVAPAGEEDVALPQSRHTVAPATSVYLPAGQTAQALRPSVFAKVPALQGMHESAPFTSTK